MSVFARNTAGKSNLNPHNKGNERESFFGVQAKLNVGKPNDKFEVEADKVADTVVSKKKTTTPEPFFSSSPLVQNKVTPETKPANKNSDVQKKTAVEDTSTVQSKLKVVHNKHVGTSESFFQASPIVQNKKANEIQKKDNPEKELQKKTEPEKINPPIQLKLEKEESVSTKIESPKAIEKTVTSKSLIQPKKEEDIQKKNTVEKIEVNQNKTDLVKAENPTTNERNLAPKPLIQKKKEEEIQTKEEEEIQSKEEKKELQMSAGGDTNPADDSNLENNLNSSKGSGSPLPEKTKAEMESGFGTDFSNVRIHNDSNAVQMNKKLGAQAFANGNDIYFNEGKFNPEAKEGKHLLAHELTHTIQQGAEIQKQDAETTSVEESIELVYTALEGATDSDDSSIIWNNFNSKDKATCDSIISGVAQMGSNTIDETMYWLYDDMVTSDWENLFAQLISINANRVDYLIANLVYSYLSGYTSESNSNSILQIYNTGVTGDLLGNSLSKLETISGNDRNGTVDYLFGDLTSVDAHRLSLLFFGSGNLKAVEYASYWIASKIFNLIEGYTSSSDSTDIVNNFSRVPQELCTLVLYELDILCMAEWNESASSCLMEEMWQSDYDQLRVMMPILPEYRVDMNWLEWTWDKITVGFDFLSGFLQYVVCGIVGVIWGIVTVILDIIYAVIDIAIAIKDLIGLVIYFISGGTFCRENKERVWNFFSSIGQMFGAPGDAIGAMWDELVLEGSLIEGPFKQCQQAVFWVSRFVNFIVNIILIFAWGYGAVKTVLKGIETAVGLARAGTLISALKSLPTRIWAKIANIPPSLSRAFVTSFSRVINLIKSPIEIINSARQTISLLSKVVADENFYIFLRRQMGNYVEGEVEFWRNRRDFWRQGATEAELGLNSAEDRLVAAVETSVDDSARAEEMITEVQNDATRVRNRCDDLMDEIHNGREGGARPIPGSPEAERLATAWESALNSETRALLDADPDLRRFWHEMDPDIRRLLTYCNSPCIPIGVSQDNIVLIGQLKQRLGIPPDHIGLREYLHMSFRSDNNAALSDAIRALDDIPNVAELDNFFDNELIRFVFADSNVIIRRNANGLWEYPVDGGYIVEFEFNTHSYLTSNRGGTDSFFQSHHGIQNAWAKARLGSSNLYSETQARAILLRTRNMSGGSRGTPHGLINRSQGSRLSTINTRTFLEERAAMMADLRDVRVPDTILNAYVGEVNTYFRGIFDVLSTRLTPEELNSIFGFTTWQP